MVLKVIVLFCYSVLAIAEQSIESNYHWGRGLKLVGNSLTLGGYANAAYENLDHQGNKVAIDDLSLFITWNPSSRLHFFSELEFEDAISSNRGIRFSNQTFLVERLYADFLINETSKLRFGKFLTPVGIWNSIHAAPLVWTTTRPLITERSVFAAHTSGLMLSRDFIVNNHNLVVSVYADDSQDLDPKKNRIVFKNALGTRINYEIIDHLQLGFSFLTFKNQAVFNHSDRNLLFGGDFLWKKKGFELQSEFAYRHGGQRQGNEVGLYLQAVAPLGQHFSAVGRYEFVNGTHHRNNLTETGSINLGVAGIVWRPYTPLAIKTEYRFGGGDSIIAPDGFFTSISTFF